MRCGAGSDYTGCSADCPNGVGKGGGDDVRDGVYWLMNLHVVPSGLPYSAPSMPYSAPSMPYSAPWSLAYSLAALPGHQPVRLLRGGHQPLHPKDFTRVILFISEQLLIKGSYTSPA